MSLRRGIQVTNQDRPQEACSSSFVASSHRQNSLLTEGPLKRFTTQTSLRYPDDTKSNDSPAESYQSQIESTLRKLEARDPGCTLLDDFHERDESEKQDARKSESCHFRTSSVMSEGYSSSMTIRSTLTGTLLGMMGATITQLFYFKPASMKLQPLALQMLCFGLGIILTKIPGPRWWNPGPFHRREATFASIIATSGSASVAAMQIIIAQRMLFSKSPLAYQELTMLYSSQIIGFGWAGLIQPLLVYPARATFPSVLPSVALLKSFTGESRASKQRIKFFINVSIAMMFSPALRGISIFCLIYPKSHSVTNIFGGAHQEEGFGFLSLSLDWATVGAHGPLYTPLNALYHHLAGWLIAIGLSWIAYQGSWFASGSAENFPFLSGDLYTYQAKLYPFKKAISLSGIAIPQQVAKYGLPFIPNVVILAGIFELLATSSALTNVILHHLSSIRSIRSVLHLPDALHEVEDVDRTYCRRYQDFPKLGYMAISALAGLAALWASMRDESVIPHLALAVSLSLSAFLVYGNATVNQGLSMLKLGALTVLKDMKLAQYMHVPPIMAFIAKLLGTLVGVLTSWVVARILIKSLEEDSSLLADGHGRFSNHRVLEFGSDSISWGAFGTHLYTIGSRYFVMPLSFIVGFILPVPFYLIHKLWPKYNLHKFHIPLLLSAIGGASHGVTSGKTMGFFIAIVSQIYIAKRYSTWYKKYILILSAALTVGTQLTVLVVSFLLEGGAGITYKFPQYFLNPPSTQNLDYCLVKPEAKEAE
ncbi:putative oligopeptide transporter [Melampsora americana]|nr:putative oligopeptide transporter [Melampsora americana]